MLASIATPGDDEKKAAGRRVPTTPGSGRVWKKGKTGNDEGDGDLDMTALAGDGDPATGVGKGKENEGPIKGGKDGTKGGDKGGMGLKGGGTKGGGGRDLTAAMMEEQVTVMMGRMRQMQEEISMMKKAMEDVRIENEQLKNQLKQRIQNNKDKEVGGGGDQVGGRVLEDAWKDWKEGKGKDQATTEDHHWDDGNIKWEQKAGGDWRDDWWTRTWRVGGNYDRQNEMVARGFDRNTYWKEIKEKVEEVMGKSGITYNRVRVIGEKSSFAIIRFDQYENKQEFKKWLAEHGKEVKGEKGMWFGDNVDKKTRDKEVAVGLVVKALMAAKEGRRDVYRDYKQGKVWVGNVVVAKWEDDSQVMTFRGEGKVIRVAYKASKVGGWRGEEDEFSE